ncbi:MAG: hypothetical protein FJX22_00350 [Alphaproteobacteria bacterium]|nr:hypothetical protein [Alphaproteobacteria bacterium]
MGELSKLIKQLRHLANVQRFPLSSDEHATYRAIVLCGTSGASMKDLQEGQRSLHALTTMYALPPPGTLMELIISHRKTIAVVLAKACLAQASKELTAILGDRDPKSDQKAFFARLTMMTEEPVNFSLLQELRGFILEDLIEDSSGYHVGSFWHRVRQLAPTLVASLDTLAMTYRSQNISEPDSMRHHVGQPQSPQHIGQSAAFRMV